MVVPLTARSSRALPIAGNTTGTDEPGQGRIPRGRIPRLEDRGIEFRHGRNYAVRAESLWSGGTAMTVTRKTTVVLVDDEPCVVRVAQAVLNRNFGSALDIYATTDAKDARDCIAKRRCDILLSDLEMPGVHGIEMLKVARKYNTWTRVVFMTAHSTWDRIAEAIEHGAADYLLKPVDHDQLIGVVQQERDRLERWHGAVRGSLKVAAS